SISGAVAFTFAKPSQYAFMPTIVLVKYPGAPVGEAGLQSSLNSRTKSAATTWRGGLVSQFTPVLRRSVYVFPSALMPPFARVGTAVARSGASLIWSENDGL